MQYPDFREKDEVYHFVEGHGKIVEVSDDVDDNHPIGVLFDNDKMGGVKYFTRLGQKFAHEPATLSFTPYNMEKGGLSHKRPPTKIPRNTLVFVRNEPSEMWQARFFSHFNADNRPVCFNDQKKDNDGKATIWGELKLKLD